MWFSAPSLCPPCFPPIWKKYESLFFESNAPSRSLTFLSYLKLIQWLQGFFWKNALEWIFSWFENSVIFFFQFYGSPRFLGQRNLSLLNRILIFFSKKSGWWIGSPIASHHPSIFALFLGYQLQVFGTSFGFYSLFLELWIQLWQDRPVRESMSFQKKLMPSSRV